MTVKCRACRAIHWKGSPCVNADCPKLTSMGKLRLKPKSRPITVMVRHGYHAEYVMRPA